MSEEVKQQVEVKEEVKNIQENINTSSGAVAKNESDISPEIKSEVNKQNWAKFREEREKERKARLEAEKIAEQKRQEAEALRAAMEALVNKNTQPQQNDSYYAESDEDRVQKMVADALAKERQKILEEQKKREVEELPKVLRNNYKDFDQVCNTENLDYLDYHYPEVSKALSYMPEGVEKWSAIYNSVKKFVPYGSKKEDAARIEKNLMKPQAGTPNMTDTKPQGSPWMLSEERKKANWERMQRDRKSFSMQ